jgi:hypothetical protein
MTVEQAAMAITPDNFDPNSDARPPAWRAVRYQRVLAREGAAVGPDFLLQPETLEKLEAVRDWLVHLAGSHDGNRRSA